MKTALSILAHAGAFQTVGDFMPRWKSLGIPVIGYYPDAETSNAGFDEVRNIGESAHAGLKVFRRFLDVLQDRLIAGDEVLMIAEYDTVNLTDELPEWHPGWVTSYYVQAHSHDSVESEMQVCALSPWIMDAPTAAWFIVVAEGMLETDPDGKDVVGLLDRWIGQVLQKGNIPLFTKANLLGYPWHPGAVDRIKRMGYNWIHGWKTKEDFGGLLK